MTSHTAIHKSTHKINVTVSSPLSRGETAAAMTPPDYGIDFVDHGLDVTTPVQRVEGLEEEDLPLQAKSISTEPIQREQHPASKSNHTSLPDNLKSGIEHLSGYSMDDVEVHYNSSKPAELHAHAYAQGNEIHLASGQEKHLPHEAWHVVQQKQGRVRPTMNMKAGVGVNDDAGLEREADLMGERALSEIKAFHRDEGKGIQNDSGTFFGKSTVAKSAVPSLQLMSLYHGTEYETAKILANGKKIAPIGKGELGGGFYMTHDMYQAAHIADYYCGKEGKGEQWGVVEFDIDDKAIDMLKEGKKVVMPDEFDEYYESVKKVGNEIESVYGWTVGPIKDAKTPYIQHLIARNGIKLLNNKDATNRNLVLFGTVGVDKDKYRSQVESYDVEKDPILDALLQLEEPSSEGEESSSEDEAIDFDYLEERVAYAEDKKASKLTKAVLKELKAEKGETKEEQEKLLALIKRLSAL